MKTSRRDFVIKSALAATGMAYGYKSVSATNPTKPKLFAKSIPKGKRIGIIGLDTSHCIEFTKVLNDPVAGPEFAGYKVVSAYPKGSNDIESSVTRIPGYIEEIKK